ncbi:MAG TPA: hypothetical protein VFE57_07005 [Cyclobacteriaceae bacterium]|jgi:hypothetical protein|nr:hypothetical protein [Cyclobacteriaceae bacterium]
MDSKQINELIEKYWNCETSLEEEQLLREYFNGQDIPESLKEVATLFQYFEREKTKSLDPSFDENVKRRFREGARVRSLSMVQIVRIAAGVFVVIAATFFIRKEIKEAYPDEIAETYTDPKVALEETKKALMMISNSFNKAEKGAGQIKIFNEAETRIQGKAQPAKDDKKQL